MKKNLISFFGFKHKFCASKIVAAINDGVGYLIFLPAALFHNQIEWKKIPDL